MKLLQKWSAPLVKDWCTIGPQSSINTDPYTQLLLYFMILLLTAGAIFTTWLLVEQIVLVVCILMLILLFPFAKGTSEFTNSRTKEGISKYF